MQRTYDPSGCFVGFRYDGVEAGASLARIHVTPELFDLLRIAELEIATIAHKKHGDENRQTCS